MEELLQGLSKEISTHTLTWSVTSGDTGTGGAPSPISTHTLTWSVTFPDGCLQNFSIISTHTLTWSVTTMSLKLSHSYEFQLTRSRGA